MKNKLLDDKYKIIKKLGRGGFGIVYLAEDSLAKREVAIKALLEKKDLNSNELIREIEFLASIQHPSIVTFHHHITYNNILYLVMEYCKNGSLEDLIKTYKKLSVNQAIEIAIKICEVLEFIHNKNIVHHDIKPSNILMGDKGVIKVSDFGIANTHGGSLHYLSPEIYISEYISSEDVRVDIYALGITFLEMIIGENPFIKFSRKDVLSIKINHNFIPTNLAQWLQEIILKATNPIPELRFQTATEFKEALIAKCVPYNFNRARLNADKMFYAANRRLSTKNWKQAINYINAGLELHNSSALGLLTAGKYYLKINDTLNAKGYFEQAIKINPSVNIKKELAEINITEENYSQAISHLQNHLQLNPIDWEAYNLLAECFYNIQRFDTALEIIESVINEAKVDCFWNNWYITKYCLDNNFIRLNRDVGKKIKSHHFVRLNFNIINDIKESNINKNNSHGKLLYQDYRFNKYQIANVCTILKDKSDKLEFNEPLIAIGRNVNNNFIINDSTVSRRHCIIINYSKDVWIYNLESTQGVYVDNIEVKQKHFLSGKHRIRLGNVEFEFYSSEGLLI